jgi:hypothetical protein
MRLALAAVIATAALAGTVVAPAGATNECRGIQACIRVVGPWVMVPAHGAAEYLVTCPQGRSIVAGLDAQVTSREVHVDFVGRIGAPVGPGVTTTRYVLFRAVSSSQSRQLFQPLVGCVPASGGGGRSTVSARVSPPGPSLELRSRIVVISPGAVKFGRVACLSSEHLVGAWHSIAFRTKNPPKITDTRYVRAGRVVVGNKVVLTASATDALSIDVHAVVQVGAECGP